MAARLAGSFLWLILVSFLAHPAAAETIIIRSGSTGNSPLPVGSLWSSAHSLVAPGPNIAAWPLAFSAPFNLGFNSACVSTTSPKVIAPAAGWVTGIPFAPNARWVSHNTFSQNDLKPGRSALICIPFTITTQVIGSAVLKFSWACDDILGDPAGGPNTEGVYVNHGKCGISGGSFSKVSSLSPTITGLVHPGLNNLFVYLRDTQGTNSGVIFSAVITVCPPGDGQMDVAVRSGSRNGGIATDGQSTDARCFRGDSYQSLKKLKFDKCDKETFVDDSGNVWSVPTGGDPSSRWIFWKKNNGSQAPVSALVRQSFYIPWSVSSATMTFEGTGDDRLGDPSGEAHPDGVFLDQIGQNITASSRTVVTAPNPHTVSVPLGTHNLFVYVRDTENRHAGAFYKANFHLVGGKPCSSINDPDDPGRPAGLVAFPVGPNQIKVQFDRDVTMESAEEELNYQAGAAVQIVDAMLGMDGRSAVLTVFDESGSGVLENLTVSGLVAADTTLTMTQPASFPFYSGVAPIPLVQSPDPVALGQPLCVDRSRFAGLDSLPGEPIAITGVCAGRALDCFSLIDSTASARAGVLISGCGVSLERGFKYTVTGRVMESEGQTILMDIMDVSEVGQSREPRPVPCPLSVLRQTVCDVAQNLQTGEDYEGMLVVVSGVTVVRGLQGGSFAVRSANGAPMDTLTVCGVDSTFAFSPTLGAAMNVTGLVVYRDGRFQIAPREMDDLIMSFAGGPARKPHPTVYPYPGNPSVTISFDVPQTGPVDITIYDLRGAVVRRLVQRSFSAGNHRVVWHGETDDGTSAASGMYFYRLSSATERYEGKIMILK